jgi:hypothetical protein
VPLALALLAIDVMFVVHAAKTGRLCPWAYIILAVPILGAVAYVIFELAPQWQSSTKGPQARAHLAHQLDPQRRYVKLSAQLATSDTIANHVALAQECLSLGKFDEAKHHYDRVLAQPLGDEPSYMVGRARAEFGMGRALKAVATLDKLKEFWPDYQSAEAHLLYARALDDAGRNDEALAEYQALASYYAGAEARARWALLLGRLGRAGEAKVLFADIVASMHRAPKHVRKVQAEWIATAEAELRA